jgi:DNA-binding Lrp family transcriptional regulator
MNRTKDEFRFLVDINYFQSSTLEERSERLGIPLASLKRMIKKLRSRGLIVDKDFMANVFQHDRGCSAIVGVEIDIPFLRQIEEEVKNKDKKDCHYTTEEELLHYIKDELVNKSAYKGRIYVEKGQIIMGSREFGIMLTIHAFSQRIMFEFVRNSIEKLEGIRQTQTLMIAYSY